MNHIVRFISGIFLLCITQQFTLSAEQNISTGEKIQPWGSIDSLSSQQQKNLNAIVRSFKIKGCCNGTILQCIDNKSNCVLAHHLHTFTSWLIAKDTSISTTREQLDIRYRYFTSEETFPISTAQFPQCGDSTSGVTIVAYFTSSCNLCKRIIGVLHDSLTNGSFKGKASLIVKPFSAGSGDRGLMAAYEQNKFWELFSALANIKGRFTEEDLFRIADSCHIDTAKFRIQINDQGLRERTLASRNEGVSNGVEITPTFFINNKRYRSYKDPQWVIDAALYETGH